MGRTQLAVGAVEGAQHLPQHGAHVAHVREARIANAGLGGAAAQLLQHHACTAGCRVVNLMLVLVRNVGRLGFKQGLKPVVMQATGRYAPAPAPSACLSPHDIAGDIFWTTSRFSRGP